ncbi:protamine-2 (modular protein) [Mesorhizobium sp. DCY119]|nr:protamine-2 (modular protein) [Mesorhizobium sp. DCY119]
MDRRLFLTGMLGLVGGAALVSVARPASALAGIPDGSGILDELNQPETAVFDGQDDQAEVELVDHRRSHRRHDRRHNRRHRRRVWRRVCRRHWRHGRRITRCYRERVWIWVRF